MEGHFMIITHLAYTDKPYVEVLDERYSALAKEIRSHSSDRGYAPEELCSDLLDLSCELLLILGLRKAADAFAGK
jgi:hypothetical protein